MKKLSSALALLLAIAVPTTALAQTRVIGDLSQGALLGEISSTAQLQTEFTQHGTLIAQASERLGLTRADFDQVREDVRDGLARYVELPRHLDGMAGERHGVAFAVHDVVIPAHVHGWEVDLDKPDGLVRVFVPNACGNISYVRTPKRRELAAVAPFRMPAPAPIVAAVTPPPPTPAPAPTDTPVPTPSPAPAVAPAHHSLWPLLALIPLMFFFHGGGNTGMSFTPVHGQPTPVPTICPPPVFHLRPH